MIAVAWFAAGVAFGVAVVAAGVLFVAHRITARIEREAQRQRERLIVTPIEWPPEDPE